MALVRFRRLAHAEPTASAEMRGELRSLARPLRRAADLDPLLVRIGDARCVLLGEASHSTHEYYTWRAEISKRLIVEKGFRFIAVEGDWPDCFRVNRFVKGREARLLDFQGPQSKAIVWEPNTHISDARYTDMAEDGIVNVGQLARERYGERGAVLVGFGSDKGSVIAGEEWALRCGA